MTQARLAEALGISASYLNLIEHNKRPLTASLLIKIATLFELDLATLSVQGDDVLSADLREVFADPMFDEYGITAHEVRELAVASPATARAVLHLFRHYNDARSRLTSAVNILGEARDDDGAVTSALPSEEITDFIQHHNNHFADLEHAAASLWSSAALDSGDLDRSLRRFLERELGITVRVVPPKSIDGQMRRFNPVDRWLALSERLAPPRRTFQLAHQIGEITQQTTISRLVDSPWINTTEARELATRILSNYFAGAVLMPYEDFLEASRACRYDVELLQDRYGRTFEQICHRMTTLQRPGQSGVPFSFVRVDIAGNVSKQFSATGRRFPRFGGTCARWAVHKAFLTPYRVITQLSRMPDGETYFEMARTVRRGSRGHHARPRIHAISLSATIDRARGLVYADGLDLEEREVAVPTGMTCRLCSRSTCDQRVMPALIPEIPMDESEA